MRIKFYASLLVFMICSALMLNVNAQTANNYIFSTSTGATLDPMSGATTIVAASVDDQPSTLQNIGFTFVYEGVNYTQYSASPDGFIRLGSPAATSQFTNSITSTTNIPKLFPMWDDLATGVGGSVQAVVTGSAPNRILKIQWFVTIPRNTSGAANATFQAWLYETQNSIEFRYGNSANPSSASVGINGTTATNYRSVTTSSHTVSSVAANNTNNTWPGNGRMYTFTPPSGPNMIAAGSSIVAENCVNGALDPGESITISFCVQNNGIAPTVNLVGTLQATGGVTSPSGPQNYGVVVNGGPAVCRNFTFTPSGSCGGTVTASLQLQDGASNLGTVTFTYTMGTLNVVMSQNFDGVTVPNLPAGWSTTFSGIAGAPWVTSNAGSPTPAASSLPNSAFIANAANVADNILQTPSVFITSPTARLTFRNNFNLESSFDGGVLEISIGAGPFQDILAAGGSFVTGGYTGTLFVSGNPIGGRQAWTGSSAGFITTTVNLPAAAAGQSVRFRFREGSDASVANTGWRVDDVSVASGYTCCIPPLPCDENFDALTVPALPNGWTATTGTDCAGSDPWATVGAGAFSAPNAAFVNDPNCISDEYLTTLNILVTSPTASVTFRNNFNLENGFDGMVLEISIGGGPFTDIITAGGSFVTGGYTGPISVNFGSPIGGRQAWTGNSAGYIVSTANLPASANGQSVRLRWRRATDSSVAGVGAFIDDIGFTGADCACRLTCPSNITVSNDPNQCGAVVNFPAPQFTGPCSGITASPASGSFFPRGTTIVTVTSSSGATCTFNVVVNDVQPPTITCPANITTSTSPGVCGAFVTFAAPSASDNCPGVTVVSTPASGSLFPVGTTTVTSTATDASGNTATCSFTITVNDTENPQFGTLAPIPERLYYKFDGSGTAIPNLASAPPPGTATANIVGPLTQGSTGKCGQALVGTGVANAHVNTGWATNLTAPWTISFWLGPNQVDANPSYLFGEQTAGNFRAFYGGAAGPNNMLVRGGSADIMITGVNPAATFITIVYNGSNTVVYKNGGSPQTYPVTFNNSGPGPFRVGGYSAAPAFSINGRMDEFGMYSRALNATEVLNLFNACPLGGAPCPSNIVVNNAPGTCGQVVTYTAPIGVDNCPGVTTTQIAGLPSGATFPVGVTTNTFRATDASGNQALCTFTVTVNDNQAPVITCPANITVTTPIGSCTAVVNYTVTATDNCPGVTTALISGPPSGSAFPLGVTTVTWRATDASGNTSQCSFTVTVIDGQLPVISQQPQTTTSCVGRNVTFSVVSSNVLSYQWQTFSGGTWNNIAGATTSSYTVNNITTAMNTNTYRVILTGLCTTVTSASATLFVNTLPQLSLVSSLPPFITPGQFLTITATGMPPGGSYVWLFNGNPIPGVSGNVLSGIGINDLGSYVAVYTDPNGCTSTSAALVVSGLETDKMWVYPNPNFGQFTVRFYNSDPENATVNVFNAKGQKVYSRTVVTTLPYTNIDIDLGPTATNGTYIVELVDGSGNRVGATQVVVRPN